MGTRMLSHRTIMTFVALSLLLTGAIFWYLGGRHTFPHTINFEAERASLMRVYLGLQLYKKWHHGEDPPRLLSLVLDRRLGISPAFFLISGSNTSIAVLPAEIPAKDFAAYANYLDEHSDYEYLPPTERASSELAESNQVILFSKVQDRTSNHLVLQKSGEIRSVFAEELKKITAPVMPQTRAR